jgi:hypothetical protein
MTVARANFRNPREFINAMMRDIVENENSPLLRQIANKLIMEEFPNEMLI